MADVFISHTDADAERALTLTLGLEAKGYSVWNYKIDSHGGAGYLERTRAAILDCRLFVLLISEHCVQSTEQGESPRRQMGVEVVCAHEAGKKFVPVLYDCNFAQFESRFPVWKQVIADSVAIEVGQGLTDPTAAAEAIDDEFAQAVANAGCRRGDPDVERLAVIEAAIERVRKLRKESESTFDLDPARVSRAARAQSRRQLWGWPRRNLPLFYMAAAATVVGLLLLRLDPFGIATATQNYSRDLANQVLGSWYPAAAREKLAVVLITDEDLEARKEKWPPSYRLHARILASIRAYQPSAVFLDVVFFDRRDDPSLDFLVRELERYREDKIPVYAATFDPQNPEGIRPEISRLVTAVPIPKPFDPHDRGTRRYPVHLEGGADAIETAAVKIYRDRLESTEEPSGTSTPILDSDWKERFSDPIELVWGTRSAHVNALTVGCKSDASPWQVVYRRFRGGDVDQSPCPYTPTMMADWLLRAPRHQTIDDALRDSVVLYGTQIAGIEDIVHSPTHGPVPGVYFHAMALDNLFVFGDRYRRSPDLGSSRFGIGLVLDFSVLFAAASAVLLLQAARRPSKPPAAGGSAAARVAILLVAALVVILAWSARVAVFRLVTPDWLAFIAFTIVVAMLSPRLTAHRDP